MNFLAHAYLSGNDEKILVGNFIGDFVKGKQALQQYEPLIAKGIALHRAIDLFTDGHSIVHESKNRLRAKYRHYAGVIVDVYYDHFLASNWNDFHSLPLEHFASHIYNTMEKNFKVLPADFRYMMSYMTRGNWLLNYAKLEGISRALSGMASRTSFTSKMEQATEDLKIDYDKYKSEFYAFFEELKVYCDQWLVDHAAS